MTTSLSAQFRLIVLSPARTELHPLHPIDEIILDVPPHHVSSWLHQDLAHRLGHVQIPVTSIRHHEAEHVAGS